MATEFIYTTAANVTVLREEIEDDGGITTALDFIIVDGTDLHIHFVTDLSGAEETALNAVVAAHTGLPPVEPPVDEPPPPGVDEDDPTDGGLNAVDKQKVATSNEVSTTAMAWVDIPDMVLTTKDLGSTDGCYLVFFTAVFNAGPNNKFVIRILVGGSQVHFEEFSQDSNNTFNGRTLAHLSANLSNISEVKIQWQIVTGTTLSVKRRELIVFGLPAAQVLS